mgnify:CR=1 FL=1
MNKIVKTLLAGIFVCSTALLLINIYGLSQDIRPVGFTAEQLRFGADDITLTKEEVLSRVKREPRETDAQYSARLTELIADGLAHIHWERYENTKFHQLVPIWDNWIIHFMGRFSGIPEYERYHFSDPYRSLERGIGICGDASMIMTQFLEKNGIEASMLTFPGHVVVTADIDGKATIFDPDFGVVLPFSPSELSANVDAAASLYVNAGYTEQDRSFFLNSYSQSYRVWTGPEEFITKKFYFEKFAYVFKWLLPLVGVVMSVFGVKILAKN